MFHVPVFGVFEKRLQIKIRIINSELMKTGWQGSENLYQEKSVKLLLNERSLDKE